MHIDALTLTELSGPPTRTITNWGTVYDLTCPIGTGVGGAVVLHITRGTREPQGTVAEEGDPLLDARPLV